MLRVEELGVNALRGLEATADDENFGGDVTRGGRLGCFDGVEELLEHPQKRVVVLGSENLGDKGTTLNQEIRSQAQRLQGQLGLGESILNPGGTDVGGTIVEYGVCFPSLQMASDCSTTLFGGNIALEADDSRDRLDRGEIDTDDDTLGRHALCGNLTPTLL